MSDARLRVDVLLHRLCIARSRTEAKSACDAGAVQVDARPARASQEVSAGQRLLIRFPRRILEIELRELPGKSTSRQMARELYRTIRDEPLDEP